MQYLGSKNRIAKHILPIILAERKLDQYYVEPFVGGANMIDKVCGKRVGNDNNEYLIALLTAVQGGWIPPTTVDRDFYFTVKNNPANYEKHIVGFVGFLCSFGVKWWGGYASNATARNYADVGSRSLVKQSKQLHGILFTCQTYETMVIPQNSLIYCDPPYEETTRYSTNFDHSVFWQWCRDQTKEGHTVFISEYSAPDDFKCVASVHHFTTLNKNSKDPRTEKLFKL